MSPKVGLLYAARDDGGFLGPDGALPDLGQGVSDELAAIVDDETKRILDECYAVAEETLARERGRLEALAAALLERESLDEDEIRRVTGLPPKARPPDGAAPPEGAATQDRAPTQDGAGGAGDGAAQGAQVPAPAGPDQSAPAPPAPDQPGEGTPVPDPLTPRP
jgi:cell division protease FtsH